MKVSLEDFKSLLSVPKSYSPSDIDKRVLKPVMKELPSIFKGLKSTKSNHDVEEINSWDMNSLSKKETTQKWIDDKFGNAGETKTHHLAVKLQSGMTLIIKTKLLQKAKKSLKELSKSL